MDTRVGQKTFYPYICIFSDLLTLPDDLAMLEEASKTPVEQLSLEVTQLDNQIKKIQTQMSAPNIQADVKNQSREFLQVR